MNLPEKHKPVFLKEVIDFFNHAQAQANKDMVCIDCTLGQAGHSFEIFKNLKRGVLLSIDLSHVSIEWTAKNFDFNENNLKQEKSKKWMLFNDNFSNIKDILVKNDLEKFDFLLADLGFSNLQLTENLGISYSSLQQTLDMRYGKEGNTADEILNGASEDYIAEILFRYTDMDRNLVIETSKRIIRYRKKAPIAKVKDVYSALGSISKSAVVKLFQALRIVINKEDEKLLILCELIKEMQSDNGVSLIITFNQFEELILEKSFGKHEIIEPNIKEIISNQQSRSAKLHIFKTKSD